MTMPSSDYDVVVIGGGPAGSTTSTILAQHGLRVGLFERERFPRFHIGESLIPETYWVLKRLNMLPKMQRSHFVKKYSVQFVNASGRLSAPFYFWDNKPHECSQTWQVVRSEFDHMMLNNAREHGVEAFDGVHVLEVLFEGDRASGVRIQDSEGRREIRAQVVVDASGQAGLLQNRFKLRLWDPILNKGAIWTYWEGAYRDTGRDEGATMVLQTASRNGWFWYIPLHNDVVSVGVVAPFDYLFKGRNGHEQTYQEEVDRCPAVKTRVSSGRRVTGYFATRDYSYRAREVAGPRLGPGRRRLRVSRSSVFVRRAAGPAFGRNGGRCDCRGAEARRRQCQAVGQVGADLQRRYRPDAPPRVRVTTTASASAGSSASIPSSAGPSRISSSATSSPIAWTRCGGRWNRCTSRAVHPFRHGTPAWRRRARRTRSTNWFYRTAVVPEWPIPIPAVSGIRVPVECLVMGAPNQPIEPRDAAESGFRYLRRVQFHETDQAGVAHFSWFFRYMEEAEHALWRAAGLSIDRAGCDTGWPRVSATFDFKSPLVLRG